MKHGFLIIETLVSLFILGIIMVAIFPTLNFMLIRIKRTDFDSQAGQLLEDGIEVSYNVIMSNWDNYHTAVAYFPVLNDVSHTWELKPGAEDMIEGKFNRTIVLLPVCRIANDPAPYTTGDCGAPYELDPYSLVIHTSVSWTEKGDTKKVQSDLLLTSRISY